MRATGIVRRVDDLGRVIIPKEIRHTMKIKEGEPLEIYVDKHTSSICFQKYNYAANIEEAIKNLKEYVRDEISFRDDEDATQKLFDNLTKKINQMEEIVREYNKQQEGENNE